MKTLISLSTITLVALFTQGCAFTVGPYRIGVGENIQANLIIHNEPPPPPPEEVFIPEMIIIENGVRHDRYFYERHPEHYHRDRMRYPERFVRPDGCYRDPNHLEARDSKDKKKKKHDDHDR